MSENTIQKDTAATPKYSGYGYHGGGRKATGVKRVSFSVSCQPEDLEALKAAAKEKGVPLSRLIIKSVLGEK